MPGQRFGAYSCEAELGAGSKGTLYVARHDTTNQPVALRVIHPVLIPDTASVERFRQDFATYRRFNHPCVVKVYDTGVDHGHVYITTELLKGMTLAELLRRQSKPALSYWVAGRLFEAAKGLAHAHKRGVAHFDVRPSNVFLQEMATGEVQVRVKDFGVLRLCGGRMRGQDGRVYVDPTYLAPEIILSLRRGPPADIYGLGLIGFLLLTARWPFALPPVDVQARARAQAIIDAHRAGLPKVREVNPQVPERLAALIDRCLAPNQANRPATGKELSHELEAILREVKRAVPAHIDKDSFDLELEVDPESRDRPSAFTDSFFLNFTPADLARARAAAVGRAEDGGSTFPGIDRGVAPQDPFLSAGDPSAAEDRLVDVLAEPLPAPVSLSNDPPVRGGAASQPEAVATSPGLRPRRPVVRATAAAAPAPVSFVAPQGMPAGAMASVVPAARPPGPPPGRPGATPPSTPRLPAVPAPSAPPAGGSPGGAVPESSPRLPPAARPVAVPQPPPIVPSRPPAPRAAPASPPPAASPGPAGPAGGAPGGVLPPSARAPAPVAPRPTMAMPASGAGEPRRTRAMPVSPAGGMSDSNRGTRTLEVLASIGVLPVDGPDVPGGGRRGGRGDGHGVGRAKVLTWAGIGAAVIAAVVAVVILLLRGEPTPGGGAGGGPGVGASPGAVVVARGPRSVVASWGDFVAYDDGTVESPRARRMWQRDLMPVGGDPAVSCQGARTAGHTDWRLPTIGELRTLVVGCPATGAEGSCPVFDASGEADLRGGECAGCEIGAGAGPERQYTAPPMIWPAGALVPLPSSTEFACGAGGQARCRWQLHFSDAAILGVPVRQTFSHVRCVRAY